MNWRSTNRTPDARVTAFKRSGTMEQRGFGGGGGIKLDDGFVILSFDGGTISQLEQAFPYLVEQGVSHTLYANAALVGTNNHATWEQLLQLGNKTDIQNYIGYNTTTSSEQVASIMESAISSFQSHGISVKHMAYPQGYFDDRICDIIDNYMLTGRTTAQPYGLISKNSGKYKLAGSGVGYTFTDYTKSLIDQAKAEKKGIILFIHEIGDINDGYHIQYTEFQELVQYCKSINIQMCSVSQMYKAMNKIDVRLGREGAANQIDVFYKNQYPSYQMCVERSTDGTNFTEIAITESGITKYSDTGLNLHTNYYYRVRGKNGAVYTDYSGIQWCSTQLSYTITSTGNGTGVAKLTTIFFEKTVLTLDGNARFYTDAAGTQGETTTYTTNNEEIFQTLYIRCSSGTSNLTFSRNALKDLSEFTSGANAPSWGGNLTPNIGLRKLSVLSTNNTLSCDITKMINIEYIYSQLQSLSGLITDKTKCYYLRATNANTLSGNPENLVLMQYYEIGLNTTITLTNITKLKSLCSFTHVETGKNLAVFVNQALADFILNKDEPKPIHNLRFISIYGNTSSAPTGQGIVDKAFLQAYRSPSMDANEPFWNVNTR